MRSESSTLVLPFVGSKVPLTIDPVIKLLIGVGLGNPGDASSVTIGLLGFVKSIIPFPLIQKNLVYHHCQCPSQYCLIYHHHQNHLHIY